MLVDAAKDGAQCRRTKTMPRFIHTYRARHARRSVDTRNRSGLAQAKTHPLQPPASSTPRDGRYRAAWFGRSRRSNVRFTVGGARFADAGTQPRTERDAGAQRRCQDSVTPTPTTHTPTHTHTPSHTHHHTPSHTHTHTHPHTHTHTPTHTHPHTPSHTHTHTHHHTHTHTITHHTTHTHTTHNTHNDVTDTQISKCKS